jgi:hypothetical protein
MLKIKKIKKANIETGENSASGVSDYFHVLKCPRKSEAGNAMPMPVAIKPK